MCEFLLFLLQELVKSKCLDDTTSNKSINLTFRIFKNWKCLVCHFQNWLTKKWQIFYRTGSTNRFLWITNVVSSLRLMMSSKKGHTLPSAQLCNGNIWSFTRPVDLLTCLNKYWNWVGYIRPNPDDRLNKNRRTEFFWP